MNDTSLHIIYIRLGPEIWFKNSDGRCVDATIRMQNFPHQSREKYNLRIGDIDHPSHQLFPDLQKITKCSGIIQEGDIPKDI